MKDERKNIRLADKPSSGNTSDYYNNWSYDKGGFWAGFTLYFAFIIGIFYLVIMYLFDKEK